MPTRRVLAVLLVLTLALTACGADSEIEPDAGGVPASDAVPASDRGLTDAAGSLDDAAAVNDDAAAVNDDAVAVNDDAAAVNDDAAAVNDDATAVNDDAAAVNDDAAAVNDDAAAANDDAAAVNDDATAGNDDAAAGNDDAAVNNDAAANDAATGNDASAPDASAPDAAAPDASAPDASLPITLCPQVIALLPGESVRFTAFRGAPDPRTEWTLASTCDAGGADLGSIDPQGNYTAPATIGCPAIAVIATSMDEPGISATGFVELYAATPPSVPTNPLVNFSGVISYAGARTGRIYITLREGPSMFPIGGTSIDAPGPFVLRGVPMYNDRDYMVDAWVDTLDTGRYNEAADPYAMEIFRTGAPSDAGLSGWSGSLTLLDPIAVVPPAPSGVSVIPLGSTAGVGYNEVTNAQGQELADHYRAYAALSPNPGPGNFILNRIARTGPEVILLESLPQGVPLWFSVAAINNGTEGTATSFGPVTLGTPPAGGRTASGRVDLPGLPLVGSRLYVVAQDAITRTIYATSIIDPPVSPTFSIPGLPDGLYQLIVILNRPPYEEIGLEDPHNFDAPQPPLMFEVQGADVSGLSTRLEPGEAIATAVSQRYADLGFGNVHVDLRVRANLRLPVRVALGSGPGLAYPRDAFIRDGRFETSNRGLPVAAGNSYRFDVTYSDGTTCNLVATTRRVLADAPSQIRPVGTGTTAPVFEWAPPAGPLPPYVYRVQYWEEGASGRGWTFEYLPSSRTSQQHLGPPLTVGARYNWYIELIDDDGNRATRNAQFVVE